jgi:predicted cupin superfamily sugar epimerase
MTADYWIDRLALKTHEEGGWYREVWVSDLTIPAEALPRLTGETAAAAASSTIFLMVIVPAIVPPQKGWG